MTQKCSKCKISLNKPYYRFVHITDPVLNQPKIFCLSCWKQEENNYRAITNSSLGVVEKYGDGKVKNYFWDEESKRWQTEKGEVDEDCQSDNSRERERANSNSDCWTRSNY